MDMSEAYNKFHENFTDLIVLSCYEYDSRFVFQAVSKEYANKPEANEVFDSLYSVEKTNGKLTRFKPIDIPADEYNRGKKISIIGL